MSEITEGIKHPQNQASDEADGEEKREEDGGHASPGVRGHVRHAGDVVDGGVEFWRCDEMRVPLARFHDDGNARGKPKIGRPRTAQRAIPAKTESDVAGDLGG